MRRELLFFTLIALVGCERVEPPAASVCHARPDDQVATAADVCANLQRRGCVITDCRAAYDNYAARVSTEEFRRLTACYARATSCDQVDDCERACGADGGMVRVGERRDAASADVTTDASRDADDAAVDAPADVPMDVQVDASGDVAPDAPADVEAAVDVTTDATAEDVTDAPTEDVTSADGGSAGD